MKPTRADLLGLASALVFLVVVFGVPWLYEYLY